MSGSSGFGLLLARDLRDLASGTAFRVLACALALLAVALAAGAAQLVLAAPAGAAGTPGGATASLLTATMLYFGSLLPLLAFLWVFAGAILMKEKASGHLETLLATPLSTRILWLAKAAAVGLPGLVTVFLSLALTVIATTMAARLRPDVAFTLPASLLVVCGLGNPLLFSGLGAVTTILALASSPDSAIVPSFAVGFGLMAVVPAGMVLGVFDPSSWSFAAGYLGAGVLEWLAVLLLARGLTKERIVLSSRED